MHKISITYDPKADCSYIYLQEGKHVVKTIEVVDNVLLVDVDENGMPVGIELISTELNFAKRPESP